MPRPPRVFVPALVLLHACDPQAGPPAEAIAPEGDVDVASHVGAAGLAPGDGWALGPPIAAGDLDGDGHRDLAVTRWREDTLETETRVVYGSPSRLSMRSTLAGVGTAIASRYGGGLASALGDVDGDAATELLVWDAGDYVFRGGERLGSGVDTSSALLVFGGGWPHQFFPAGDVDGDGVDDVGIVLDGSAMGVWENGAAQIADQVGGAPEVHLFRGEIGTQRFFVLHDSPGDLDADGFDDLVYAINDETAGVWGIEIVYGRADLGSDPLAAGDALLVPEVAQRLAGLGDLDGDGRADVLTRAHEGGAAVVLSTVALEGAPRLVGEHALADVAVALTDLPLRDLGWAGDLDGDGALDVFGMHENDAGRVVVSLWYGPLEAADMPAEPDATITFPTIATGPRWDVVGLDAQAAVGMGDLDADGFGELAVSTDGTLWVFYGGPRTGS